jgi:hypothetical protein
MQKDDNIILGVCLFLTIGTFIVASLDLLING